MLAQILWWITTAAEALVLVRSSSAKLYRKYPAFYLYLATVLALNLLRLFVFISDPSVYPRIYWYSELVMATVGYVVIVEIYNQALKNSPGVARVARIVLSGLLAGVILKDAVGALAGLGWSPRAAVILSQQLERNMHTTQTLLLMVVIALIVYYRVPTSRNLKGIAFGYSFYIAATVMSLALGSLPGYTPRPEWRLVEPVAYLVAVFTWCCTLWSYHPSPEPETESEIERDYRLLAEQTRKALSRARSFLKLGGEL